MKIKDLILATILTIIWGVNFSGIKLSLQSFDSFTLNAIRFFLCAVPWVFFVPKPNVAWCYIAAYGLCFGVGLWGMLALGIHFGASAGIASLVLQLTAFITVFLSYLFLAEKISMAQIIGALIALAGFGFIASVTDGSVTYLGLALVTFAAFSMSVSVLIVKIIQVKQIFAFLVWSSLFSPIPLLVAAYLVNGGAVFNEFYSHFNAISLGSILFQVYPATLFAYWVWNRMLIQYPVSQVIPFSFLVPVFGFMASYFIFGEAVGMSKIIAAILIILGLFISLYGERYKASSSNH